MFVVLVFDENIHILDAFRKVYEQRYMVLHDFCGERNYFLCAERAVRPNLESKLVEVGILTYAGVFNRIVHLFDGRVNGIDGNIVQKLGAGMVGALIASAATDSNFHIYLAARVYRANMLIAVYYFYLGVLGNVACLNFAGSFAVKMKYFYVIFIGDFRLDCKRL